MHGNPLAHSAARAGAGGLPFHYAEHGEPFSVVLNTSLLKYGGDVAVGAYTVIASIMQVINLPCRVDPGRPAHHQL